MLESGHFYVNETTHVRDWINTQKLLTIPEYLDRISQQFTEYIKSKGDLSDLFILGESYPGIILSSSIALNLGTPFSYVIPEREFAYHNEQEKDINIPSNFKVIIVTDAIMLGDTIKGIINWLKEKHNIDYSSILGILTIFVRSPKKPIDMEDFTFLQDKIFPLNNNFEIEICESNPTNCMFKDHELVHLRYEPF